MVASKVEQKWLGIVSAAIHSLLFGTYRKRRPIWNVHQRFAQRASYPWEGGSLVSLFCVTCVIVFCVAGVFFHRSEATASNEKRLGRT